ncbi:MAG: hypothetical protein AAGF73_08455 [Actinomycetota bacterium]
MPALSDERAHPGAATEEWAFAAWDAGGDLGLWSVHRLCGPTVWYWSALARPGRPLLHVADFEVPARRDPFIVKGEQLWAEHLCESPMEQWSIGNETYASSLDDVEAALGDAYGTPTPIAFDIEWYATAAAVELAASGDVVGYRQEGVVHGDLEVLGEPTITVTEIAARRWHRWAPPGSGLAPLDLPAARAHGGVRAPFRFPGGDVLDSVLTTDGWARRPL